MPLAVPLQQIDRTYVHYRGRKLSYFGGCDYFRLASHPDVLRALREGLGDHGLNVAASRSTTGNHRLFGDLERAVTRFFAAESALLVASGYATNLVVAQALAGEFTHALVDDRSHSSVLDAIAFLECPVMKFGHRDPADAAARIRRLGRKSRIVLLTDGMFSHDGSVAPVPEYLRVLPKNGLLVVDDAHGAGVLGNNGRGAVEACDVSRDRLIQTVSLSKAFGVYGGAVLCSRRQRDQMVARSRLFNGNTPLPLPLASAAIAAVRLLQQHPSWRNRMRRNAEYVKDLVRRRGCAVPEHPGPIVAVVPAGRDEADRTRRRLLAHGVFPSLIRYSGGPAAGYFRFMISSEHERGQLDALAEGLSEPAR